jgi:DNA-binding NarL/FixJ family response regulator
MSAPEHVVAADGPITVMVVDDHPMWRDGVARDLGERGFRVVATAADAAAAVRIAVATRPAVVLMDLNLGAGSGVEAITGILARLPETRILVLSASGEQADVLEAVTAGARGYLVKSASVTELEDAVRRTAAGAAVFTAGLAGLVLGEFRRRERRDAEGRTGGRDAADGHGTGPSLTERETEVLRLVAKGMTARQIAARLVLSHRTVESHVQNTLRKLRLGNRVELTRYALERGLAEDG